MSRHSTGVRNKTIKFFVIFAKGKENAQTYAIILRFFKNRSKLFFGCACL